MLTSLDPSISEEEMDDAVRGGHYVLQAYATNHWLDHVKEGIRGDTGSEDFTTLGQKILMFLAKRTNQDFDRKTAREEGVLELKQFEKGQKHVYRELCYINSSLATELSESLKPSKKNSEPPKFLLSSSAPSGNVAVAGYRTPKSPKHRSMVDEKLIHSRYLLYKERSHLTLYSTLKIR